MTDKFLLRRPTGSYLTDDFETWDPDVAKAHRFISGAALNACVERWRRHGARVVKLDDALTRIDVIDAEFETPL